MRHGTGVLRPRSGCRSSASRRVTGRNSRSSRTLPIEARRSARSPKPPFPTRDENTGPLTLLLHLERADVTRRDARLAALVVGGRRARSLVGVDRRTSLFERLRLGGAAVVFERREQRFDGF